MLVQLHGQVYQHVECRQPKLYAPHERGEEEDGWGCRQSDHVKGSRGHEITESSPAFLHLRTGPTSRSIASTEVGRKDKDNAFCH